MSRKASPTLIGAFVVGAVVLSVLIVSMLGAGRYFHKTYDFVLYFSSSVNGLQVGAPVRFRGVDIGTVKDIRLQLDSGTEVRRIPVIVEIDPAKIISRGYTSPILTNQQLFNDEIKRGLRGQLQLESFVTGVLFVGLDIFPGTPANFVQQPGQRGYRYREIPTEPSSIDRARESLNVILTKLADAHFDWLIDSATRAVTSINQLVSSPQLRAAVRSSGDVTHELDNAAADIAKLATALNGHIDTLSGDARTTMAAARTALTHADAVITRTDATINDSPTVYELDKTLEELSAAARSLRLFANYLERNPSSLVFGKAASKEPR